MDVNGTSTFRGPAAPEQVRGRSPRGGPSQAATGLPGAGVTAPAAAPVRLRRRTPMLMAGIALVAVGALSAALLTRVLGNTVPVVAVAQNVAPGHVLTGADLTIANVNTDPALRPVPAARLDSLVGRRAAVSLTAGSLLTDGAVTDVLQPALGRSLVGVALTASQLPAEPLQAGDQVRIVSTPPAQGEPPAAAPVSLAAVVVSAVGPDSTGLTVVNVTVPTAQAADLAARVATGRVALILDSREH